MGNTTLTVEESTLERFKSLKRELDSRQDSVPDHTSNSFLAALMDTWEATDETKATPDQDVTVESLVEEVQNQISMANEPGVEIETQKLIDRLDKLEQYVKEATDAAQSAERKVEELQ